MVTVPAFVWRGGAFRRAAMIGGAVGIGLAVLAWIDSGQLLSAVMVFIVTGLLGGIGAARAMARYWPGARYLTGNQRVTVAGTARRGERIGDPQLAPAVIDYHHGLHRAAEKARLLRWVVAVLLVVSVGMVVWDGVFGTWGNAVVSCIYLGLLGLDLFWWPRRQDQLLSNADRAAGIAQRVWEKHVGIAD